MSNTIKETNIIDGYDDNGNPIYIKQSASNYIAMIKNKIRLSNDTNYIDDELKLKLSKISILEGININSIDIPDLVKAKPYNDITRYTDYDKYLTIFVKNRIAHFLNISFDDFMQKNMVEIEAIIRNTTIMVEEANKTAGALNSEIEKLGGL